MAGFSERASWPNHWKSLASVLCACSGSDFQPGESQLQGLASQRGQDRLEARRGANTEKRLFIQKGKMTTPHCFLEFKSTSFWKKYIF